MLIDITLSNKCIALFDEIEFMKENDSPEFREKLLLGLIKGYIKSYTYKSKTGAGWDFETWKVKAPNKKAIAEAGEFEQRCLYGHYLMGIDAIQTQAQENLKKWSA